MKRTVILLLVLSILSCLPGCAGKNADRLTLKTVKSMAADKGSALTWSDFKQYPSTETGSGLYILVYDIDADYRLMIGGIPNEPPMYIYLVSIENADRRIDIRYDDIDAFLNGADR